MVRRLLRKPLTWVIIGMLAAAGGGALYWYQPWKLLSDRHVDEPLAGADRQVLSEGAFVTHVHLTSGHARIIRSPDGSRRLELVDLSTSNGPDLRVWLTDQPVVEGQEGWSLFDEGAYHELGRLKGNKGSQGYEIPSDLDLESVRSVSIWCRRFAVSFGAAPLSAA